MSSSPNHPITLIIRLSSSHPELLNGLDLWLKLGLISDTQVRSLCRANLSCEVVLQPVITTAPKLETDVVTHEPIFVPANYTEPPPPKKPNLVGSMLQSWQAELSVRWLLFLGMFLVVVSSGVLAASQWERFPGFLQYGILLAYTLSFWGASFWAGKQPNLNLTGGALLIVTLLLIPVNFWAMDTFGLWHNPLGLITVAIATLLLTSVTILLGKSPLFAAHIPQKNLYLVNLLALGCLHWGWKLPGFPVIAVYIAMIGTAGAMVWQTLGELDAREEGRQLGFGANLPTFVIIYALAMVLLRAIFLVRVDITQLGLAIGICGWLVNWLAQQREKGRRGEGDKVGAGFPRPGETRREGIYGEASIWEIIGGIFLGIGWLVTIATHSEQAIAVSGLAVLFFHHRLHTYGLSKDLGILFVIGLQAMWLGWRLVPTDLQTLIVTNAANFTGATYNSWVLWSLGLFPYVIFMVGAADRLYHNRKRKLGLFGEQLALFLGVILTTISLVNPVVRSLNLIFSTITLGVVTQRRESAGRVLVYLTHVTGLLAICSTIHWLLPNLTREVWAGILLAMMVAEFIYSLGVVPIINMNLSRAKNALDTGGDFPQGRREDGQRNGMGEGIWRRSAWVFGLGLAGTSFVVLWDSRDVLWSSVTVSGSNWGIMWLIVPVMLTVVGVRSQGKYRQLNGELSIIAVMVAQLLTLPFTNIRLIGLLTGAVLMAVNTAYLRQYAYGIIAVGFGLSTWGTGLWEFFPGLSLQIWLVIAALTTLGLWLSHKFLKQQEGELAKIYGFACDKWAIAFCIVELLSLSFHSVLVYNQSTQPGWLYLVATGITLTAIITRTTRETSVPSFYGIGWCLELLVTEILAFGDRSTVKIAIANIGLGLAAQLLGEWWQRKHQLQNLPSRWHILPLVYGVFGAVLRWDTFASWTGLSSLAVALIAVNIGRRSHKLKPLVYLGMVGISVAAYELLFYQLSQASGGAMGDGVIVMAVLGAGIMYGYRLLEPWLIKYFRLTPSELQISAHIHWVIASFFLTMPILLILSAIPWLFPTAIPLAIGTGVFLVRYAIFQGRTRQHHIHADVWVYLGLLEAGIFSIYLQNLPIGRLWREALLPWQSAIAAVIAYFIFILPWERWGWNRTPWRNSAYVLPMIILWLTWEQVEPITLIIVAAFYLFVGKLTSTFRFSYVSLALVDWALWRWCVKFNLNDSLWYVTIVGLSLLYIAQIDPYLRQPIAKPQRHLFRILGTSLICGWAVIFNQDTALLPIAISLLTVFIGLGLRVRAFLYVGTATFLINVSYQSIILSLQYSFLKWVIGLIAGIILISIAANFETQRDRLNLLIRNIGDELGKWQ